MRRCPSTRARHRWTGIATRAALAAGVLLIMSLFARASAGEPGATAAGRNAFALELYGRLKDRGGNVACSPFSISETMAMTYAGARGATRDQIARVFHFADGDEALHRGFREAREVLVRETGGAVLFRTANRLWVQKGVDLLPPFQETASAFYGADSGIADFAGNPDGARVTVNAWVAERTSGQVKEILGPDDISPRTRLVLTNAITFQGHWDQPFNPRQTRKLPFHVPEGEAVKVPMMSKQGRYRYAALEHGEALEMTYADGRFAMWLLLPKEGPGGMGRLEGSLSTDGLGPWESRSREQSVFVLLPKFRVDRRQELAEVLSAMGMPLPFQDTADFSGITLGGRLALAGVVHQAVVEVDEEGTKAYAATGAIQESRTLPRFFRADRPFLFLIKERSTGVILFLGRVIDPSLRGS